MNVPHNRQVSVSIKRLIYVGASCLADFHTSHHNVVVFGWYSEES